MDPSQPTKPGGGRKFRFREWVGAVTNQDKRIEVDVNHNTTLQAKFDVEQQTARRAGVGSRRVE